jgi:hypothetical protein
MQAREPKVENVMDDDREKTAASIDNATIEKGQSNTRPCLKTSQTIKSNCICNIFGTSVLRKEKNAQMQDLMFVVTPWYF